MPRPSIISRDKVVVAALAIVDADGVEALSVDRIAAAVGVRGPSLYHHFVDKNEILAEVASLILQDVRPYNPEAEDWETWLVSLAVSFYRTVLKHPRAAYLLMQYMPPSVALPAQARAAALLTRARLEPEQQLLLIEGVEKLTWGWSIAVAAGRIEERDRFIPAQPTRWPEWANAVSVRPKVIEELFVASLRSYIRGVVSGRS